MFKGENCKGPTLIRLPKPPVIYRKGALPRRLPWRQWGAGQEWAAWRGGCKTRALPGIGGCFPLGTCCPSAPWSKSGAGLLWRGRARAEASSRVLRGRCGRTGCRRKGCSEPGRARGPCPGGGGWGAESGMLTGFELQEAEGQPWPALPLLPAGSTRPQYAVAQGSSTATSDRWPPEEERQVMGCS